MDSSGPEMANCIGYVYDDDDSSDDCEPRLQICDIPDSKETNLNPSDSKNRLDSHNYSSINDEDSAAQSLLMLGMGEPWMSVKEKPSSGRFSVSDGDHDQEVPNNPSCYYQKMREKNNAASKRCRMKRRLKTVSLEGQLNFLSHVNQMLKDRVSRLESMSNVLREGIKNIQPNECSCHQTAELFKQMIQRSKDSNSLTTTALLNKSKSFRDLDPETLFQSTSSDDDAKTPEISLSAPPDLQKTLTRPVLTPSLSSIVSLSSGKRAKTVLDILNDTIIKSLNSTSPTPCSTVKSELLSGPSAIRIKTEPVATHFLKVTSPLQSSLYQLKSVVVKNEIKNEPKVVPVESCVAACMSGQCSGPLVKLKELTSNLHTITGRPFTSLPSMSSSPLVDRNSAMEGVIIKSRIGLPFWDETNEDFICEAHRQSIIVNPDPVHFQVCVMCGRSSPQSITFLITQAMSRQSYVKNGRVLPIGRLVCGVCKNEHFRGIETNSSQIMTAKLNGLVTTNGNKKMIQNTVLLKPSSEFNTKILKRRGDSEPNSSLVLPVKIRPSPPCFSTAKNNSRVKVIIQSVQKEEQSGPTARANNVIVGETGQPDLSFSKISQLNEALKDLNPGYNSIGFSITSVKSCSPSILEEAVQATETAVSTLISAIAPGQEQYLWESVKPILDKKLNSSQNHITNINNNKS